MTFHGKIQKQLIADWLARNTRDGDVHSCHEGCLNTACIMWRLDEEISNLKAENERLREDAERYRWLRDNKHLDLFWNVNDTKWDTAAIDADIDAARKP